MDQWEPNNRDMPALAHFFDQDRGYEADPIGRKGAAAHRDAPTCGTSDSRPLQQVKQVKPDDWSHT